MSRTRRELVRAVGAATATGTVTALAGCPGDSSGDDAESGDDTDDGDTGGTGSGTGTTRAERTPTVQFSFNFDPDGLLTITLTSGGTVVASDLYVRGSGFASNPEADQTEPGPWAGRATGDREGEPAIVAGDAVTVGVSADYEIALVWEGAESATIAEHSGPGA